MNQPLRPSRDSAPNPAANPSVNPSLNPSADSSEENRSQPTELRDLSQASSATTRPVLLLLFTAGGQLYAMESGRVVEVIPRVSLRPLVHQPPHVAGVFSYRGQIAVVVDLCLLIHGQPCGGHLSSRIVMVAPRAEGDSAAPLVGLLAEGMTDTLSRPLADFQLGALTSLDRPYLAGLCLDERGMVQRLDLDRLLAELPLPRLEDQLDQQARCGAEALPG